MRSAIKAVFIFCALTLSAPSSASCLSFLKRVTGLEQRFLDYYAQSAESLSEIIAKYPANLKLKFKVEHNPNATKIPSGLVGAQWPLKVTVVDLEGGSFNASFGLYLFSKKNMFVAAETSILDDSENFHQYVNNTDMVMKLMDLLKEMGFSFPEIAGQIGRLDSEVMQRVGTQRHFFFKPKFKNAASFDEAVTLHLRVLEVIAQAYKDASLYRDSKDQPYYFGYQLPNAN